MISFEEALEKILAAMTPFPVVEIPFEQSPGLFLGEDLVAPEAIPFADISAVDGYAVRLSGESGQENTPDAFRVVGTVRAGENPEWSLNPGEAARIFTGALLPGSSDAVVMQEDIRIEGDRLFTEDPIRPGDNIRFAGEDLKAGEKALSAGTRISPPVVGLMASMGKTRIRARRPPEIAILATGNELVDPRDPIRRGTLRDSNTASLKACLSLMGIPASGSRVPDDRDRMQEALASDLEHHDILFVSGGVSVGDYDYSREVLAELGVREVFWKIRMKPGKPVYLGVRGKTVVFGIPGNPVSSLVVFQTLIRPALIHAMGGEARPLLLEAVSETVLRKKPGRTEFVRAIAATRDHRLTVAPVGAQDSHIMSGLAQANCLIRLEEDRGTVQPREKVSIELLSW